jgi:hypothetical protein
MKAKKKLENVIRTELNIRIEVAKILYWKFLMILIIDLIG